MSNLETLDSCPYCQAKDIQHVLSCQDSLAGKPGEFSLARCESCGLRFQNPRIKEEYIHEFYTESLEYYHETTGRAQGVKKMITWLRSQALINHFRYSSLGKANVLGRILSRPFVRLLRIDLWPQFVSEGSLLEIGCAHGAFLQKMHVHGWKTTGIEFDAKAAERARRRGLDIRNTRIEDADFPAQSFDVIAMSMVLEHLYDPFRKLERISQWIKPGGQLLFSIPYIHGLEFRMFKQYAYGLQLPTHITFFNKKIIRETLQKLGYSNIRFTFQFATKDMTQSASYAYTDTNKPIYRVLSKNKLVRVALLPLLYIVSIFGMTSRLSVSARKNTSQV